MSKKILVIAYFSVIILSFISCKKKEETSSPSFTWTYKGITYNALYVEANTAYYFGKPTIIGDLRTARPSRGSGQQITLSSFNTGSYTFTSGSNINYFDFIEPNGGAQVAVNGTLQLTKSDNKLSGTFSVSLNNGFPVTGSFSNLIIDQ
ncbi:MAG: hypothetical protein KA319_07620 [Ferruginibacter sp.]|nr:hypothetical protein [Ferruginibacter sp.]